MQDSQTPIGSVAKLVAALVFLAVVAGCASAPPQPAMVPIGETGEFGYREREIGEDRIEVSYIGAAAGAVY